jgi:hypothetical protein
MIEGFKSCFSPSAMVDFCAKVTLLYDWVVCLARPCGMSPGLFPIIYKKQSIFFMRKNGKMVPLNPQPDLDSLVILQRYHSKL